MTRPLSTDDFSFNGPLGCDGAEITPLGHNHFHIELGHAPEHPEWPNMLQFEITSGARGNALQIDVSFTGGPAMRFNSYGYSWSYDGEHWNPVQWTYTSAESDWKNPCTLVFPVFSQDRVVVGHMVPMSCEKLSELIADWDKHECFSSQEIGRSLEGRPIHRLTITDPAAEAAGRWVHYFKNEHPGEHNAQWRMAGMIDWLLSDEAAESCTRAICHFVVMSCPDGPAHGWYRVNGQGVDQNRSYNVKGANADEQPHEQHICQKDLEGLMASDDPVTDLWTMHTWQGNVEAIVHPGPEMGTAVGPWQELREIITANDPRCLVRPLHDRSPNNAEPCMWDVGPHMQFGITTFLCEGAGGIFTQEANMASGAVLIKSLCAYYRGRRT